LEKLHLNRNVTARDFMRMPLEPRWQQPGTWLRTSALREVEFNPTLHYRFDLDLDLDLDLLICYLQRFPRVQYSQSTLAWFRLHPESKTVSQREHLYWEHLQIFERTLKESHQQAIHSDAQMALGKLQWRHELHTLEQDVDRSRLNRLIAILPEAIRTSGAWHTDSTYKALRRVLRGSSRLHAV
jgi:hypothetical protein